MKAPTRVQDRHGFDTLIDARTPAEFAIDHIPGAVNYPVLDNEERRIVGTLYKQVGAFEARRVGGAMVAANLARHLQGPLADRPAHWKPLVYCWRGGLRSGSMTSWLRLVGWDAQQLAGGYKGWRRHVIDTIAQQAPHLALVVVCGATGTAKTRLLHALAAQGQQTLDLEGLARHKGSLLGALPDQPQPSQTAFETAIATVLEGLDPRRPLYVEGEGRRIGRLTVPLALVERMRDSPCIELNASTAARVEFLLRDYAYLGERPQWLADRLDPLKPLHGNETTSAWQAMALARQLPQLFDELVTRHYDPWYARSNRSYFRAWGQRRVVEADDLSPQGIEALAQRVAALDLHAGSRPPAARADAGADAPRGHGAG
ncbi:tRNA 2-selenouridine(34) synthase MnmH [Pseudorhodoferax sp. Leaf274]|uniref:tRNA 2-selenouridine(34) synthase MnmH n=1 Tax=Pseudorhodoferax sp. Leaf274 TaxID=1736318 RepID=UPI000703BFDC|nr:tRNA 2-selenouridine(34) synthase MnmH [Pseudorhodoferax sp. Leaf274]KQP37031.1 tRNA 2-selenouridine synthase [Pseudorhodoferax sp. Leaf274]